MFVQNHMTPDPRTVAPRTPVAEAWEILRDGGFHQLPVVDGSRELIGIVTDRDIRSAVGYDATGRADLRVEDIMTSTPVCIESNRTIEEALLMLSRRQFGALPVMRGSDLVGIISKSDLLRAFHNLLGLDNPGTRIEVAIPNGAADVAEVLASLTDEDQISSMIVARLRTDGEEPVLYLRTRSGQPWGLQDRLRNAGAILLAPESASPLDCGA